MASFVQAAARLLFKKRPQKGPSDEEQAAQAGSATLSSTLGAYSGRRQSHGNANTGYLASSEDPLTLYRLMLGITIAPELGFNESGIRPADNIGLYARVVHSEQTAKDSYKVFSVVINACYFLQIIVAAALTAMGAANANNKAITAFGAFNTIIAGFLTYLKGSGLPGRLKYFGNEWKKIREFIELRERDFSHEGCTLDVYDVVETIRQMYANTKRDIELNTPDSYNSVMAGGAAAGPEKVGGMDVSKLDDVKEKLQSLDNTMRNLKDRIETKAHDIHDTIHAVHEDEKRIETDLRGLGKTAMARLD